MVVKNLSVARLKIVTRGVNVMAEEVKQIKIGVIDLEKDSLDIITKIKAMLEKVIQESKSVEDTALLSDTVLKTTSQIILEVLDAASEEIKTEEAQKIVTESMKGANYTVSEIQSAIKFAKKTVEGLPTSSSKLFELVPEEVKKLITLGISLRK